jgi:hypothetical protein
VCSSSYVIGGFASTSLQLIQKACGLPSDGTEKDERVPAPCGHLENLPKWLPEKLPIVWRAGPRGWKENLHLQNKKTRMKTIVYKKYAGTCRHALHFGFTVRF